MTDDRHALNAIARALNPHWPEGHRGTYHPHELADLVTQRAATILEQSARIVELEAEVKHWKTHAKMMAKVADNHKAHEKTLETERDAVRKALAWFNERPGARSALLPAHGSGELLEAALLAAAREGEAP